MLRHMNNYVLLVEGGTVSIEYLFIYNATMQQQIIRQIGFKCFLFSFFFF